MAEVAGLVVGGVGLAALFDSCMSAFRYIESGKRYGTEYQKIALKIALLQLRLSRWAQPIEFVENIPTSRIHVQVATAEEAERVKDLLGQIFGAFEQAEKASSPYKLKDTVSEESSDAKGSESMSVDKLTERVRNVALSRQRLSSVKQKTVWALRGERKFNRLVDTLKYLIGDLVDLFPVIRPNQRSLAETEVGELIHPSEIEEPTDGELAVKKTLEEATNDDVDDLLGETISRVAVSRDVLNSFTRILTSDGAAAKIGHYVAKNWKGEHGPGSSTFDNIRTIGQNSRAQVGNSYGGQDVNIFSTG